MGEVYLAEDTELERRVALKFLPRGLASDSAALDRFRREARAAARLDHPNIVTIHEIGTHDGHPFIVMAHVEGQLLRDVINQGDIQLERALDIIVQIGEGLDVAHAAGVVHRDIKPENIILDTLGKPQILDFGLAKLHGATVLTQEQSTLGTTYYMSPEQARGVEVDARSDIFSLGVVAYELIAGQRPFRGNHREAVLYAITTEEPQPLGHPNRDTPAELEQIVGKMLAKDPGDRYQSARDVVVDLRAFLSKAEIRQSGEVALGTVLSRWARRPATWVVVAVVALGAAFGATKVIERRDRIRWAREEALPEIQRLYQDQLQSSLAAYRLAERAQPYLEGDPEFEALLSELVIETTIATEPPGATVYSKPYEEPDAPWELVGTTPIENLVAAAIYMRVKIEKPGFETLFDVRMPGDWDGEVGRMVADRIEWKLHEDGSTPAGMVFVPGGGGLPDFWVDRHEVTNRQFKEFVDSGGYSTADYWKFEFVRNGMALSRDEAMALFVDTTGRPGPGTWEAGSYPAGEDDFPVTGISWYEAAAFAEFAGKSLPTLHHWKRATGSHIDGSQYIFSRFLIPLSNFSNKGPIEVGTSRAMTPLGAVDMAGNVREWCWNESEAGRCLRGGAWTDEVYMFGNVTQATALDRSERNGLRCVKYVERESVPTEAFAPNKAESLRDLYVEQPVSDEVFRVLAERYEYDDSDLDSKVEDRVERDDWVREKISFNSAYGNERVLGQLFLPAVGHPPYQTIVYFAGDGARSAGPVDGLETRWEFQSNLSFVITSGRAVFYTVYQGTHERRGGAPKNTRDRASHEFAEYRIQQVKDILRSVDYLETRDDIDADRIALYGFSRGGAEANLVLAVDDRFKAAISLVGGMTPERLRSEIDHVNFTPRVTTPILMLNGRYDMAMVYGTEVKPMFDLLGTPQENKLLRVYDSDHIVPRKEVIKETLAWLDKYLGAVSSSNN